MCVYTVHHQGNITSTCFYIITVYCVMYMPIYSTILYILLYVSTYYIACHLYATTMGDTICMHLSNIYVCVLNIRYCMCKHGLWYSSSSNYVLFTKAMLSCTLDVIMTSSHQSFNELEPQSLKPGDHTTEVKQVSI